MNFNMVVSVFRGLIRRAGTFSTGRIERIHPDPHVEGTRLFLHYGGLSDSEQLTSLIYNIRPDEIYNFGAQSHVSVSFDMPEHTGDITATETTRLLEAVREPLKSVSVILSEAKKLINTVSWTVEGGMFLSMPLTSGFSTMILYRRYRIGNPALCRFPPPLCLSHPTPVQKENAWRRAIHLAGGMGALTIDHHLLRCGEGCRRLDDLKSLTGRKVICAADFMGCRRFFQESWRERLYHKMPVPEGWYDASSRGDVHKEMEAPQK